MCREIAEIISLASLVIDPSLLRALVLTILWSSQLQAPMARTLMISFHKIIGGYLSPFATSFALRPSGSIRRHMRAIKHPLESETEFSQRSDGRTATRYISRPTFSRACSRDNYRQVHKSTLDKMQRTSFNVNYFFKVRFVER